jgi:capsular polysaccharide biosynthesis protein
MHEAFDIHRLIPEAVAERLLAAAPGPVRRTAQLLYLSRSRLPSDRRHVLKEQTLEQTLREKKCKIVYHEKMGLDE